MEIRLLEIKQASLPIRIDLAKEIENKKRKMRTLNSRREIKRKGRCQELAQTIIPR